MYAVRQSRLLRWIPHFHSLHDGGLFNCPSAVRDWIITDESLTLRLRHRFGNAFTVRLLGQYWGLPSADEALQLGISDAERILVREVLLLGQGIPLIAARSVLPASVLRYTRLGLSNLGTRPLGEVLFAHRQLGRSDLVYARVKSACWQPSMRKIMPLSSTPIWGRRSRYTLAGRPLLVAEFFLPTLFSPLPIFPDPGVRL